MSRRGSRMVSNDLPEFRPRRQVVRGARVSEKRSYETKERNIKYDDAFDIAYKHQKQYPDRILCGSVALMISRKIPMGPVSDIDFVSNSFPAQNLRCSGKYQKHENGSHFYHFELDSNIDLFVTDKRIKLQAPVAYWGIAIQSIEDILYWKGLFNRDKDRDDLLAMSMSLAMSLEDDLFEI